MTLQVYGVIILGYQAEVPLLTSRFTKEVHKVIYPVGVFTSGLLRPLFILLWRYTAIAKDKVLVNEEIRAKEVRLLDNEGTMLGVVPLKEALEKAAEANLDLVNISPNAAPPVCKIMDFGKYRYEQQKREKDAKKKQKNMEVRDLRLGVFIEQHDLETKAKIAAKFLAEGDKVKANIRLRGREMGHADSGKESLLAFCEMLKDVSNIEKQPQQEGRNLYVIIAPKSEKEKAAKDRKEKENGKE